MTKCFKIIYLRQIGELILTMPDLSWSLNVDRREYQVVHKREHWVSQQNDSGGGQNSAPSLDQQLLHEGTTLHLAQAWHVSHNTLPIQGRHAPNLQTNHYPEVTKPIWWSSLPTLFYRLEAFHLGDLLRILIRTGATPPRGLLPEFQDLRRRSGCSCNCSARRIPNHIFLLEESKALVSTWICRSGTMK